MIYSLRGQITEVTPTYIVMEVNGVGYYLGVSLHTSNGIEVNSTSYIYVQQIIREDAHLLFGFITKEERELFNLLISVSGVGAVSALILLSSLSNGEIASAILSGNSGLLQNVKGIGAKTAERIIIDLRDKVSKFGELAENIPNFADNKIKDEALSALEVLGIARKTSEKLADRFLKINPATTVEDLIKQILKNI